MPRREHSLSSTARALRRGLLWAVVVTSGLFSPAKAEDLADELKTVPYKIVYETWQNGNWELFLSNANGSGQVNLTATGEIHELYPHVSPDGSKVCFVCDEGEGALKQRNVYYMNIDGGGRKLVARNARQPCWNPEGTVIAYLKGESGQFSIRDYATRGLFFYDVRTGRHTEHVNHDLYHVYNPCWSPDAKWFLATVHAGMGFRHAILAFEAEGTRVFDLGLPGCRPEFSPEGKRVAWGAGDYTLRVAGLDLSGQKPKVSGGRDVVTSAKPDMIYHFDWSPDGKYFAFTRGRPKKVLGDQAAVVGNRAEGWNICVADAANPNRWTAITVDGHSNKEPDWVPMPLPGP
ncbi:MAG: hypothetical protein ACYTG0_01700 [Planctomycetota bacterium]|jgi:Tol biopolymer transport system component